MKMVFLLLPLTVAVFVPTPSHAEMSNDEIGQYLISHSPGVCVYTCTSGCDGPYSGKYSQSYTGSPKAIRVENTDHQPILRNATSDPSASNGVARWTKVEKGGLTYTSPAGFDVDVKLNASDGVLKGEARKGRAVLSMECQLRK